MTAAITGAITTLQRETDRIESIANLPSGSRGTKILHHYATGHYATGHYATGQSPVNPELHGVWLHTMSQESLFITSFPSNQEASMSAAALNRARPFEAPILRKLSQQET